MLDTDLWNLCMNLYFCENIYEVKATKICVLLPGNHVTNVEYYFLVESPRPKEELSSEICKEKETNAQKLKRVHTTRAFNKFPDTKIRQSSRVSV